jgi:DNA polymerase IV
MAAEIPERKFDLSLAPPIFVLPTHLQPEELHETEDVLYQAGGHLTYDTKQARVFIGRVTQKKRAAFDLRAKGVWSEEAALPQIKEEDEALDQVSPRKRTKVSASVVAKSASGLSSPGSDPPGAFVWPDLSQHILVLKLAWLEACRASGTLVSYIPYIVYTAKIVSKPDGEPALKTSPTHARYVKASTIPNTAQVTSIRRTSRPDNSSSILERARAEAATLPTPRRRWGDHSSSTAAGSSQRHSPPKLHRTTTSEMEYLDKHPLPPLPDWASGPKAPYACCRSTFLNPPNATFIAQLTKIKETRLLRLDDIGVRAYSTSIASISAYPYRIEHAEEITRLPGCEQKIAALWREWQDSADTDSERCTQVVKDLDAEPDVQGLRLFWNVWGVGPDTARKFYFDHGWRDLDDVVEFGWSTLTRVQQIGVKYYDEFLDKIPRKEVEDIRDVILRHTRLVLAVSEEQFGTDEDAECVIVGGYRRGKAFSGDVDVIVSHRDEAKTYDLVINVVRSLEEEGWVTHTLTLNTTTSDRGQATLPFRGQGHGGHGFDSLDKALCVWQNPHFEAAPTAGPNTEDDEDAAQAQRPKNPNIHRRVDIIVSVWRTVGCAVLGWSGGTTFQRDIRRFVNKFHHLKFDSSGVRNRGNGMVLDLEAPRPRKRRSPDLVKSNAPPNAVDIPTLVDDEQVLTMLLRGETIARDDERFSSDGWVWDDGNTWLDRERRLMDGLGIGWRPAEERCTG